MADTNTPEVPPVQTTFSAFVSAVIGWLFTICMGALAALPPDKQQQIAAVAGTFFGTMLRPIIKEEVKDAFALFTEQSEFGKPDSTFDAQFDELRK